MAHPFLDRLATGPLLVDGAMGTMLYERGIDFTTCFEHLVLVEPTIVQTIHRRYIEAGADIIETNTYGANRLKLDQFGLADKVGEINYRAVKVAREAREIAGRSTLLAGAVGPLGRALEPFGPLTTQEAYTLFVEQIEALLKGGADLLFLETFSDLNELEQAIKAARATSDLPIVAQMTFAEDGKTTLGHSPEEMVRRLSPLDVAAIGVNCSVGPQRANGVLTALRQELQTLPNDREKPLYLSALPNAGWPTQAVGRVFYPSTPAYMAGYARRWVEELGVGLIGGCCGTTPEHTGAMRAALDQVEATRGAAPARFTITIPAATPGGKDPDPHGAVRSAPTHLEQLLAANTFVVSVEIDPPKGHNPQKCLEGAQMLKEAGIPLINVGDSPMARVRMSALTLCVLIQQRVGLETILHFTTRDRSLMGLQSDLLGAHAQGVRNILALKGDPPSLGNYPGTTGVFDVDTIGLVKVIKGMNHGRDTAGNDIGQPTHFFIGVALNINAADPDWEIDRLQQKVAEGAHFAMTQPCYDIEMWENFLNKIGRLPIPVLMGLVPLQSYRNAEFLHNELPGNFISEQVRERMRLAGSNGRQEGVKIAQEILLAARQSVNGVYIMPAFGRYEIASEVVAALSQ